jgi:hypothetical protein
MSERGRVIVLLEALYHYRYHLGSATVTADIPHRTRVNAIRTRCLRLFLEGRDYHAELHDGDPTDSELRLSLAETISTLAAMQVWAGNRPRPLPDLRALAGAGSMKDSLRAAIYGWLGYLSPRGVRAVADSYGILRDRAAGRKLKETEQVEWNFGRY